MIQTVGFIGLGVMGRPMARHILANGAHQLMIRDLNREHQAELLDSGAIWANSLADMAKQCQMIIAMVPEIGDVRSLLQGESGLLSGTKEPWTLVISSTCSAQEVRDLQAEITAAGKPVTVVDAPVSGGAEGAESGILSIMVGGPDAEAALACQVLKPAGEPVHLGPLGSGQVAKACNQLIVAAEVVAIAEAAVIAERAGLDVAQLFGVLQNGYAGSRIMEVKAHRFVAHDHSPSGPAKFMIKDLRAAAEEAECRGVNLISLDALRTTFRELTEAGMGDNDTSVVQAYIESRSPITQTEE